MEISKMLTISIAHIKEQTLLMLASEPTSNRFPFIVVYPKSGYGYFLYIDRGAFEESQKHYEIPADLIAVIDFTIGADCNILCLDCDGEELQELETY